MERLSKMLLCIDAIALAFYLGYIYGKRAKRRKRKPTTSVKHTMTKNPLQIEVNVANHLNEIKTHN